MISPSLIESRMKELPSEQAATLLMEAFPIERSNYSEAFRIIPHRSWKRADQIRLARFYLKKIPFSRSKPYEVFASFMAIPILISIFREVLPSRSDDRQFFIYYVTPALAKNVRSSSDRTIVEQFLTELDPTNAVRRSLSTKIH